MSAPLRRFICEHQVVPDLTEERIREIHARVDEGLRVLYTFSNLDEKCMYSVIESRDRRSVEKLFESLRVQCDCIMEIEVQGEGTDRIQDLRPGKKAA